LPLLAAGLSNAINGAIAMTRSLKLPQKLVYVALGCSVAGAIACGSVSSEPPAREAVNDKDASTPDAKDPVDAADAEVADAKPDAECENPTLPCGPIQQDASCPAFVCSYDDCDPAKGCIVPA
jgi:hypothetical protein